jgi:hypothetical protein
MLRQLAVVLAGFTPAVQTIPATVPTTPKYSDSRSQRGRECCIRASRLACSEASPSRPCSRTSFYFPTAPETLRTKFGSPTSGGSSRFWISAVIAKSPFTTMAWDIVISRWPYWAALLAWLPSRPVPSWAANAGRSRKRRAQAAPGQGVLGLSERFDGQATGRAAPSVVSR